MKDKILMLQCQEAATEEELKEMGMRQRFRKNQRRLHIDHNCYELPNKHHMPEA